MTTAALYRGHVMHARSHPKTYRFRYAVFSLLVDVDRLDELARQSSLLSVNRFNLFSLHERDHGAADGSAIGAWARGVLAEQGIELNGGRIRLLCFPRVLGYAFNPLSTWYCEHADGSLRAVIYEVRNTFGERHVYVLHANGRALRDGEWHVADKAMHVSPFLPMRMQYRFRVNAPSEQLAVLIDERETDTGERILLASLRAQRHQLDSIELLRCFFRIPLMTTKVIAAIHWQALKLWLRGFRFYRKPGTTKTQVTRTWQARIR